MSRIDTQKLDQAMRLIAQLIASGCEVYWPIMDRLAQEKEILDSRRQRLDNYLAQVDDRRIIKKQ